MDPYQSGWTPNPTQQLPSFADALPKIRAHNNELVDERIQELPATRKFGVPFIEPGEIRRGLLNDPFSGNQTGETSPQFASKKWEALQRKEGEKRGIESATPEAVAVVEKAVAESASWLEWLPKCLSENKDADFTDAHILENAAREVGLPVDDLNYVNNSHGTDPDGRRLTVWEHTMEAIRPYLLGNPVGLHTEGTTVAGWTQEEVRALLRLTVFFHDVGKCYQANGEIVGADRKNPSKGYAKQDGHEMRSANKMDELLSGKVPEEKRKVLQGIIRCGECYTDLLRFGNPVSTVFAKIDSMHDELGLSISHADFRKLVWVFFIADAGTLAFVGGHRVLHDFRPSESMFEGENTQELERFSRLTAGRKHLDLPEAPVLKQKRAAQEATPAGAQKSGLRCLLDEYYASNEKI